MGKFFATPKGIAFYNAEMNKDVMEEINDCVVVDLLQDLIDGTPHQDIMVDLRAIERALNWGYLGYVLDE